MSETNVILVKMAEGKVAKAPVVLESTGLGSCVAICLYDPATKAGGLAHVMLPEQIKNPGPNPNPYRYADAAVSCLAKKLEKLEARVDRLEAKLVGGANMFQHSIEGRETDRIGEQTVEAAKEKFKELGIKLVSDETGGSVGRSVQFDLANGIVTVSTKM